jgi:sugar/nucleoside kinase (ribokinase family)
VRAQHVPAAPAAVVNLSGAGDTLTGGFAAALVRGRDPVHALALGIAAAQVRVQCAGMDTKINIIPATYVSLRYVVTSDIMSHVLVGETH